MSSSPVVITLYLRYRLWIAALNFDITILRILADYLEETLLQKPDLENISLFFNEQFTALRKEIDDIRNEMHLTKMKLAAFSKENDSLENDNHFTEHHSLLEQRYNLFRQRFESLKSKIENYKYE